MQNAGRIWFLLVIVSFFTSIKVYPQLIEKAPSSPVAVQAPIIDSVDSVVIISDLFLTGFKKTKPYIIQREVPFKKGQSIATSELGEKLKLSKQQLMNTSLFVDCPF